MVSVVDCDRGCGTCRNMLERTQKQDADLKMIERKPKSPTKERRKRSMSAQKPSAVRQPQTQETSWSWLGFQVFFGIILSIFVSLFILFFLPGEIKAESYSLGEPFPISPDSRLSDVEILFEDQLLGPECIAVHPSNGMIYTGLKTGQIVGINIKEKRMVRPIKLTDDPSCTGTYSQMEKCGRPLGMRFSNKGHLYYVDAYFGLNKINLEKSHKINLVKYGNEVFERRPVRYLNDFDLLPDGRVVLSESSYKFDDKDYLLDVLEHKPNGRVLLYDPSSSIVNELTAGLYFPNGVQVWNGKVYVAEMGQSRIIRINPSTGRYDIFLDNIPGYPDNIRLMNDGRTMLVPLPSRRSADEDALFERPKLREMLAKVFSRGLLEYVVSKFTDNRGLVLKVDMPTGEVVETLEDPTGRVTDITVAVEDLDNNLIFGSDNRPYIAKYAPVNKKH